MICSHALVGAAGQTTPINHLEPPLQKVYVVVVVETISCTNLSILFAQKQNSIDNISLNSMQQSHTRQEIS